MQRKLRHLSIESLENRSLLAGNISVTVTDGNLVIIGDAQGNGFRIEADVDNPRPHAFRIRTTDVAGERTLLNGTTDDSQVFTGVTNDINIALAGGEDEISVGVQFSEPLQLPRNLSVDGGADADDVLINAAFGTSGRGGYAAFKSAALQVVHAAVPKSFSGTAINQLLASGNVNIGGNLVLRGTGRGDTFLLDGIKASNLDIETFSGADHVRVAVTPTISGDVEINMGDGADRLGIGSLAANNLRVNLGNGNDSLTTWGRSHILQEARISGSQGIDKVLLNGFEVDEAMFAWLYTENDHLEIKNSKSPRAVLGGGPGTDTLVLGSGNDIDSIEATSFEA